jgi:hypothetical protein
MISVSLNIGADGSGILNTFPIYFECDKIKEFNTWIRGGMFEVMTWADDLSWDVKINCKNIREYKQFLGLSHEEIDQIVLSRKRDDKINSIVE